MPSGYQAPPKLSQSYVTKLRQHGPNWNDPLSILFHISKKTVRIYLDYLYEVNGHSPTKIDGFNLKAKMLKCDIWFHPVTCPFNFDIGKLTHWGREKWPPFLRRQAIIWTNDGCLLRHICVTRPQWVNQQRVLQLYIDTSNVIRNQKTFWLLSY